MMKKLLVVLLAVFLAVPVMAAEIDNLTFGGQVKMRGYKIQNMWDFNDDADGDNWSVFRYYTALNTKVNAGDNVTGFVQVANQHWGEGISDAGDNVSNKIFVDNAYIEAAQFMGAPLTLKLGRQNLMYGSGFVVFDGQSQLGSTAIYFDGAKLTFNITDTMTLDGFYMKDFENSRDDATEDDVTLGGGYFTAKGIPVLGQAEAYVLNKRVEAAERNLFIPGIRLSNKLEMGLDYSLEVAMQTGDFVKDVDQEALGIKAELGYTIAMDAKPRFSVGYASMSGDDPSTEENERWDVVYGGWPQWGDLLTWKYLNIGPGNSLSAYDPGYNACATAGGEAVYSNLDMITVGASATMMEKVTAMLSGSMLTINETAGDDDFGTYYQANVNYKYSASLSFGVYAAILAPGDAFGDDADNASEYYWEAALKF